MRLHPTNFMKQTLPRPVKKGIKQLIWTVEGSQRTLPDFLIIGAQKAGTTSLYEYLIQHPQIIKAEKKELQFFSINYCHGAFWYRSKFPTKSKIKKGKITGEATPYYLFHPHAPKRILKLIPNVKLIVLLRDPVDRAISHYFHNIRIKEEYISMEEAFRIEEKRIEKDLIKMQSEEFYNSEIFRRYSYKRRGIYADQLFRYIKYFRGDQLLILKSEDLFSDPKSSLKKVFNFLEVDTGFLPSDLQPKNIGNYSERVSPIVYKELADFFVPHNTRLYSLLGQNFGWRIP